MRKTFMAIPACKMKKNDLLTVFCQPRNNFLHGTLCTLPNLIGCQTLDRMGDGEWLQLTMTEDSRLYFTRSEKDFRTNSDTWNSALL
jgi:hypothetical protein